MFGNQFALHPPLFAAREFHSKEERHWMLFENAHGRRLELLFFPLTIVTACMAHAIIRPLWLLG